MVKKLLLITIAMLIIPSNSGAEKFIPPALVEPVVCEAELEHEEPMNSSTIVKDSKEYVGNFKITYYCTCSSCCGSCTGITASGTQATAGRTIASDISILPFGTKVHIDGLGDYVCEDTGGAIHGYILDVLVESHEKALQMGVDYRDVYIIKED